MTRLRDGVLEDARAIAEVHVASWRWAYREVLPPEVLSALSVEDREQEWREGLRSPPSGGGCLVAEDDGRIVGFVGYGPAQDEGDDVGEVFAIYLVEDAVGRGIGRDLLARAEEALRSAGFRRAVLWVFEANDRACRFYEKAGWAWDGARLQWGSLSHGSAHRIECGEEPIVRYAVDL